jgi:hypothetical protein
MQTELALTDFLCELKYQNTKRPDSELLSTKQDNYQLWKKALWFKVT